MAIREFPRLIEADAIEFGRDPNRTGITRMFDDFLGGTNNTQISAQFNTFGSGNEYRRNRSGSDAPRAAYEVLAVRR